MIFREQSICVSRSTPFAASQYLHFSSHPARYSKHLVLTTRAFVCVCVCVLEREREGEGEGEREGGRERGGERDIWFV